MATTYIKVLKAIEIKTVGGTTVTAEDTAEKPIASNALAEFDAFKTMHIETEGGVVIVPFHAVDSIEVTISTASATKADPYGCEEDGETGETETGTTESGGK